MGIIFIKKTKFWFLSQVSVHLIQFARRFYYMQEWVLTFFERKSTFQLECKFTSYSQKVPY